MSLGNMVLSFSPIKHCLQSLKSNKAPGGDSFNLELFKYASQEFLN
jgi:hypothetical protein